MAPLGFKLVYQLDLPSFQGLAWLDLVLAQVADEHHLLALDLVGLSITIQQDIQLPN